MCKDVGAGGLAKVEDIVAKVQEVMNKHEKPSAAKQPKASDDKAEAKGEPKY